jgi:hypothetical protein
MGIAFVVIAFYRRRKVSIFVGEKQGTGPSVSTQNRNVLSSAK